MFATAPAISAAENSEQPPINGSGQYAKTSIVPHKFIIGLERENRKKFYENRITAIHTKEKRPYYERL